MRCQRQFEIILRHAHRADSYPTVYSSSNTHRLLSTKAETSRKDNGAADTENGQNRETDGSEDGAMTRRMKELSEEAMLGGKSAMKNMQEAGSSNELKQQLEERIAASSFKNDNVQALSIANMPV